MMIGVYYVNVNLLIKKKKGLMAAVFQRVAILLANKPLCKENDVSY